MPERSPQRQDLYIYIRISQLSVTACAIKSKMSGLDIAAGAASIVGLCNLVVSKLVPFLRDPANADKTVKQFHREICDFKDVLVIIEANYSVLFQDLVSRRRYCRLFTLLFGPGGLHRVPRS
jgi:hypothetical protein